MPLRSRERLVLPATGGGDANPVGKPLHAHQAGVEPARDRFAMADRLDERAWACNHVTGKKDLGGDFPRRRNGCDRPTGRCRAAPGRPAPQFRARHRLEPRPTVRVRGGQAVAGEAHAAHRPLGVQDLHRRGEELGAHALQFELMQLVGGR